MWTRRQQTPSSDAARLAATNAARSFFHATMDPDICGKEAPRVQDCLYHGPSDADSPDRGVASFGLGYAQGEGAQVVFGRDGAGAWQFWFGTQQGTYHALQLPAEMRICADGQGANVRQQPDIASPSMGVLKDNAVVTAEQFVLTQAAHIGDGPNGNGWYEVTGEVSGFIRADLVSVTSLPDCSLRNAIEATPYGVN